jgi:hypothetical protein
VALAGKLALPVYARNVIRTPFFYSFFKILKCALRSLQNLHWFFVERLKLDATILKGAVNYKLKFFQIDHVRRES